MCVADVLDHTGSDAGQRQPIMVHNSRHCECSHLTPCSPLPHRSSGPCSCPSCLRLLRTSLLPWRPTWPRHHAQWQQTGRRPHPPRCVLVAAGLSSGGGCRQVKEAAAVVFCQGMSPMMCAPSRPCSAACRCARAACWRPPAVAGARACPCPAAAARHVTLAWCCLCPAPAWTLARPARQ